MPISLMCSVLNFRKEKSSRPLDCCARPRLSHCWGKVGPSPGSIPVEVSVPLSISICASLKNSDH